MVGHSISIRIHTISATIGLIDLWILAVSAWFVLGRAPDLAREPLARVLAVVAIVTGYFAWSMVFETVRRRAFGAVDQAGIITVRLTGAARLPSDTLSSGFAIGPNSVVVAANVTIAAVGGLLAFRLFPGESSAEVVVSSMLLLIGGMALIRIFPVGGLDGAEIGFQIGRILADDDDGAEVVLRVVGTVTGILTALTGFLMLAEPSRWSAWGILILGLGISMVGYAQHSFMLAHWMRVAGRTTLDDLRYSRLPVVPSSAPISELFSIFSVEGHRAMIVVTDDGEPAGLIQLRHFRAAAHDRSSPGLRDVMMTISEVPEFDRSTTVLDAARELEWRGQLALTYRAGNGKTRVVSLEELKRLFE
jgi:hypothetical protein